MESNQAPLAKLISLSSYFNVFIKTRLISKFTNEVPASVVKKNLFLAALLLK